MISEHQCDVVVRKEPWYSAGYLPGMSTVLHVLIATSARMDKRNGGARGRDRMVDASKYYARERATSLCNVLSTVWRRLHYAGLESSRYGQH